MNNPKLIALYLPQFYETDYNSAWWGEGYTEWVACKRAKPLFRGHIQPRLPQNNNFYDLSIKENIKWQMDLAKQYGIDGFAIYQYYSCGKKLLEVPTEMIRDDESLDLPFFLYWANHTWTKGWVGDDESVLWKQEYGSEKDWRKQFEYCLEYFKRESYIKIDGKPVYFIYQPWNVPDIDSFIYSWNKWAIDEGFKGVYFGKTLGSRRDENEEVDSFSCVVRREPLYTIEFDQTQIERSLNRLRFAVIRRINKYILSRFSKGIVVQKRSYDRIYKKIIRRDIDSKVVIGALPDWDNSPRKGYNSIVMQGATPKKFGRYLKLLIEKGKKANSPMILINAWNEWAEGNYLEPDDIYGDAYLQEVKKAVEEPKD